MKYAKYITIFSTVFLLFTTSCKDTSYPCPAYSESGGKDASMKVGPDGTPINSVSRQYDENGLIKKKKVKRIHK